MLGRRRSGFAAVALSLVAVMAVIAAPAAAEGEADTGAFGSFRLKGTNGYSVLVLAFSKRQFRHGEILVFAAGKDASVVYLTHATVTPTTIDADLGPVGTIAVRFEPSGPPQRVHASCKGGESIVYEPGVWTGTIELTGEEGFTRAETDRVKAIPSPFLELGCATIGIGETAGDGVVGAKLVARSATRKRAIYLQANKNHERARVHLEASLEERRGGLIVSREVAGSFAATSFDFDPSLREANLAPAAPFSGSASFHRDAKPANQWTGNLSVDFPGRADVSLAGHRFNAALVHANRTEGRHRYDRLPRRNLLETWVEAGAEYAASLPPKRK
jgi:hypothetical protein